MSETLTQTTYVTYLYPGAFFPEESAREVEVRDPRAIAREADPGVFAFFYHDMVTTVIEVDGERIPLKSSARNKSGLYYIDAERLTAEQVAALPGDHHILLSNMRSNGWDPILRCRTGNFRPLEPGDEIVSSR